MVIDPARIRQAAKIRDVVLKAFGMRVSLSRFLGARTQNAEKMMLCLATVD
jgi:hypothetical protein